MTVEVVDAVGRRVATLWDGPLVAGEHTLRVPEGLVPGTYVIRVTGMTVRESRRLTVVR